MSIARRTRIAAVLTAGSILTACNGDRSTGPSEMSSASLSQVLSEMSRPELSAFSASMAAPMPIIPTLSPSACAYDQSRQSFSCGTVTVRGLDITSSYALLALGGTLQSRYDPATTDGVRTASRVAGTITSPGSTLRIDDQRELTLTGLLSSAPVLNGTSLTRAEGTIGTGATAIPVSRTVTTRVVNLTIPVGAKYPTSGTLTVDITEQAGAFPTHTTHIAAAFDGTSMLSITASTDGGRTTQCSVSMAGTVMPTCAP